MDRQRHVRVLRDQLRLWLRTNYGFQPACSHLQIDRGCEDLGFSSGQDAMLAYSLFGADLSPDVSASVAAHLEASGLELLGSADQSDVLAELFVSE